MESAYCCSICDYTTSRKSNYNIHIQSNKHKKNTHELTTEHNCLKCNKTFCNRSGLWKHDKKCSPPPAAVITTELVLEIIRNNKDLTDAIMAQNTTIQTFVQHGVGSNTNSLNTTNTNTNNKTFNLQIFLNDTCKNAMNMSDFVNSIHPQLSDLESVGELGFVQGISNIITANLKALDVTMRPVHCTDQKRETIYVKDDDIWVKEDDNRTRLKKLICIVAGKNQRLLPLFREKNPGYNNSKLKLSDRYDKIVLEAMGGPRTISDEHNENKIIHNITMCTAVDKVV